MKFVLNKIYSIRKSSNNKHNILTILGIKLKIKRKIHKKDRLAYINYVLNHQLDKSCFVPKSNEFHKFNDEDVKLIAFYLPQFHDFEENIKWFGPGFSEWSNTSKAVPQFDGHYQPHIPIDVGYYNLDNTDVIRKQIELAKQYGIYGFSIYYYWYSGQKVMEKPLEKFLADKTLDMPFFLFFANQDWTMQWDNGNEKQVLHEQILNDGDAEKFMADILPYMKDERYIKINNKPLMVLYDVQKYPYEKYLEFNSSIRKIAKDNGFDDLYILTAVRSHMDLNNLKEIVDKYNVESLLEFFPLGAIDRIFSQKYPKIINPSFKGRCFDVAHSIKNKRYMYETNANLFKGCFTNWDNTARKCYNGAAIYESNPINYKVWLKDIINWTKENKEKTEQFVFINAWNEWAEGAHLEPDQKYGYAYLQATKDVLENKM